MNASERVIFGHLSGLGGWAHYGEHVACWDDGIALIIGRKVCVLAVIEVRARRHRSGNRSGRCAQGCQIVQRHRGDDASWYHYTGDAQNHAHAGGWEGLSQLLSRL